MTVANMTFLPRKTNQVFIMLGRACNMGCTYCIQHTLVHESLTATINPELYDFLSQLAAENGGNLHLTFYGGEPLIYFPTIKEIIANTNYRYSIITNGKALTPSMVDFFNENSVSVTVSWDGEYSIHTRGFDVMAVNLDTILQLNALCLSGVISSYAYPMKLLEDFQAINNLYQPLHDHGIGVNLDEIMDTGLPDKSLFNLDFERVSKEAEALARLYFEPFVPANYTKCAFVLKVIRMLDRNLKSDSYTVTCGNGLNVLNVDLAGNLYTCHNTDTKIGDIHTPFYRYLQNLLATDPTPVARTFCEKCLAYPACRCGCKLVKDKTQYCKLKQALYLPMIRAFTVSANEHTEVSS